MQLSSLLSPANSIQYTVSTYSEYTVSTATDWKRVECRGKIETNERQESRNVGGGSENVPAR